MPFSIMQTNIQLSIFKNSINQINQREEYDFFLAHQAPIRKPQKKQKRVSAFTASITVEAAATIPLFFLAVVCLLYAFEIMAIQTSIKASAHSTCKAVAKETYALPLVLGPRVEASIVEKIGKQRLNQSIVVDGSAGLHCNKSWVEPSTGIVQLIVEYEVKLPIPNFGIPTLKYRETVKMKGWVGYVKTSIENEKNQMVYVTENGSVYHKDYQCTHLDLSIHPVSQGAVSQLRNEYQERYHACEKCMRKEDEENMIYITNTGDKYHSQLSCSGLKRSIYAIPLSEVQGKGACLRCGQ
ncbi:MAG: pilus assembly protein [Lachnospiraceae bacterium]|nr:pilus assembly protein [Lachnospiraceae bacterium]